MTRLAPIVRAHLARAEPAMMVTLADARGSTPRERGTRMLVAEERIHGTIGGGRLEFDAVADARRRLQEGATPGLVEVPLGPALGPDCGGRVTLLIEPVTAATLGWLDPLEDGAAGALVSRLDPTADKLVLRDDGPAGERAPPELRAAAGEAVALGRARTVELGSAGRWLIEPLARRTPRVLLFGAGHVGHALAAALGPLPCRLRWIDDRADAFPAQPSEGAARVVARHPPDEVAGAPGGAYYLVMTHSHPLDLAVCEAVLRRGDFAYLGLIGSATKRSRFTRRLLARGLDPAGVGRLVCPIGIPGIADKRPAVIAAAVAAQLLIAFEEAAEAALAEMEFDAGSAARGGGS